MNPWIPVQKKKRRTVIVVTGKEDCKEPAFRGAPVVRSFFVWNVSKETETETVSSYISKHCEGLVNVRLWSCGGHIM